jgi:hypothetical protein
MKLAAAQGIAAEHRLALTDDQAAAIVNDPDLVEIVSLVTYGVDLIRAATSVALHQC